MDELIIIGGSAAGTAAAVYAARRNLEVRLIAGDLGGEVAKSGEVENYPGFVHTTGVELSELFEKHLRAQESLVIEVGVNVIKLTRAEATNTFTVEATKDGQPVTYQAKTVILATGVHPRLLGVTGEAEYKNKGVSYCTVCDGPLYRNKRVVTIGGGNSALESAIMLAGLPGTTVTLLTKNPAMKGEAILIKKLAEFKNVTVVTNASTTKINGDQFVTGIEYTNQETGKIESLSVNGIFVHIGMIPNSTYVDIAEKNNFGEVKINSLTETTIPGLFAAGDVTDHPFKQIAIATGQGVTAALQAARYLDNLAA
jgi:alkyl hydroperoxide reductase subunit AhpF